MTIESRTTTDRRNRIIITLALLLLFTGWFGYDGFVNYPAKNMSWARQNLQQEIKGIPVPKQLKANPKALLAALEKVKPSMKLEEVTTLLGDPTFQDGTNYCYIGVASFGWFTVRDGKVAEVKKVAMNSEPTETDIKMQRGLALLLAVCALGAIVYLLRVLASRTVLDEQGLRVGGKLIGWGDMRSLDASEYARKGWLDLEYAQGVGTAKVRLDSYKIDLFEEIVAEICNRKGFTSPLPPVTSEVEGPAAQ